jgi:hypothetical protein
MERCNFREKFKKMKKLMQSLIVVQVMLVVLIIVGCNGCGGVKKVGSTQVEKKDISNNITWIDTIKQSQINQNTKSKYITDFSWKENGTNYLITFPSGVVINTDDYNPILSQIPNNAIKYEFDNENNKYFYRGARIDFTKIDRKTKLELTKNMHFEFETDVDSILYADYTLDFPYDTSVIMTDKPEISESLTLYARCWKDCHPEEFTKEIILGSMGYKAWFDKAGIKKAEFYGDKFGVGEISSDYKYIGGAVGGYYSDGGGFYRNTRIYLYDAEKKTMLFHKLMKLRQDVNFYYRIELNKWELIIFDNQNDKRTFIDPKKMFQYQIAINVDSFISKFSKADQNGYYFKDNTSLLFERDFKKIPLDKLSTSYPDLKLNDQK